MTATDIITFIVIVLALGAAWYLLHRSEARTRDRQKTIAYNLLEEKNPDPRKVREAIKMLRLYGGRWVKDHESYELIKLLARQLEEASGDKGSRAVRE